MEKQISRKEVGVTTEDAKAKASARARKFKNGELRAIILAAVVLPGAVSLALMAPNIVQVIRLFKKRERKYQTPAHLRKVVEKMRKQGYLSVKKYGDEEKVILTDKGRYELLKYKLRERKLQIPKKWDRKWRIIIFDIQEKRRLLRDKIREQIQRFGFHKLQQSVWVYPYECEELVTLLKADCRMGKELLYIVADEIEGEDALKKRFKLSC
ncbi:MAG: hypothetical protein A3E38_02130 [Candidatus Moranbacteria bacterium RIFCSPHIGHO2_12_FULL_54_9]|nr:MAG: hypothetical protein A2878_01900 [Candidatus Moranbacteria bacterium RIFCSPHIGHO2_01_FULL_54_31]OGI25261.1 MAG: hypothetical protein A3E38_02130 [Candidatus Moranbacteria bacterium RIFCSPHIGHO2_12_FULL_54_9]